MALALTACSKGEPIGATSVYLTIVNGQGLSAPDELRVTVVGAAGPLFEDQRLPAAGPLVPPAGGGALLGTVTLYVADGAGQLDVEVRGELGGVMQSEGTTHVTVVAGKQVSAIVVLGEAMQDDGGGDAASSGDAAFDGGATSDGGAAFDGDAAFDGGATSNGDVKDAGGTAGVDARADVGVAPDAGSAAPEGGGPETGTANAGADGGCAGSGLSGLVAVPPNPVDLTAEGVLDWRHWGVNGDTDFKSTAGNLITNYTLLGNGTTSSVTRSGLTFDWSDGSPRMTVTAAPMAIAVMGVGSGFEISVPAAAASHTLAVYVSGDNDTGVLTASLSDGCVASYTVSRTDTQVYVAVHRISFRSALPGTLLHVTWTMTAGTAPIGLHAATLY